MASNKNSSSNAATTPGLPQVGIIPEFNGEQDDWTVYQEILEEFFKANGILEATKVSVLISVIGTDTYRTLRDLCHPDSPRDKTYEQLCAMLAKQFIPEIAIFRERAKFYRAEQHRREDVKAWYARLKKLSVDCKFGEHLEPLLMDKFIVGLAPGPIQDRLCEENEKLSLKEAVDLAANRESALQDQYMAEDLENLNLDEGKRGWKKHGRHGRGEGHHGHHGHHGGHGPHGGHGRHGGHGHQGGHGPYGGHGPFGGHGPHGGHGHHGRRGHGFEAAIGHGHGHGPHHHGGPIDRRGPPPPEFFRGFPGFEGMERGCPFKRRGREMKRWAKKWHKHGRRASSSSSSSSSTSSSSSSSDEEEKNRKCRKGHKKDHHYGRFGHGGSKGPRGECGHGKRRGRKEQEAAEPIVTETTEPELIE